MIYTIENETLSVAVNTFGAELVSVKKDGKERLWQNENGSWAGHAPILFPFAGLCTPIINGKEYPMKRHGLASKYEFSLVSQTETALKLLFASNAETEKLFPYTFRFFATFSLENDTLKIAYEIENPTDRPISQPAERTNRTLWTAAWITSRWNLKRTKRSLRSFTATRAKSSTEKKPLGTEKISPCLSTFCKR